MSRQSLGLLTTSLQAGQRGRLASLGGCHAAAAAADATHSVNMWSQCSLTKSQASSCPSRVLATAVITRLASCFRINVEFKV